MSLDSLRTAGPWIATFADGPLAGAHHDRMFAVGPIWEEIVLVELGTRAGEWSIVGGDGIPEFETERVPWEGEVTYRLDAVERGAGVDGEPIASYVKQD